MSASLAPECNEVKEYTLFPRPRQTLVAILIVAMCRRYDSCFLKWYSESKKRPARPQPLNGFPDTRPRPTEYLRGTATTDECEPLFKQYKSCLGVSDADRGSSKTSRFSLLPVL